ncbi:MAG: choline transporter, partial [Pseudomonas formosensis]|nr:choline transporter [Halopseudomonas formosensis]
LETFLQNTGSYLNNIVERTFNLQAYSRSGWIGNWTLFIFGWTIAWAPFVGLFIAKISRGRTIRQFVFGVMLVPTFFTFFWFSVFGDTALHLIINQGYSELIDQVKADNAIALFKLLEQFPFTSVASFLTVLLIALFFVTSADSGALVVDSLASGGALDTPAWQRGSWAILSGVLASVLLLAGGLKALQSMAIASALPFAIIMLLSAVGMWRALVIESHHQKVSQSNRSGGPGLWRKRLAGIVTYPEKDEVEQFIKGTALTAMIRVAKGLQAQSWPAEVHYDEEHTRAYLEVVSDQLDFLYEIRLREYLRPAFANPDTSETADEDSYYYRAEVFLRRGGLAYDVYGYEDKELISDILDHFEKYLDFLQLSPGVLPWNMAEHDELLNTPKES